MRPKQGLLQNLGFLTAGQVASQLLNLAVLVFLADALGPRDFGIVQVGVTLMAYALITAEWGLMSLGVRDTARLEAPAAIRRYAGESTTLLLVQAAVVLLLGWLVLPHLPFGRQDAWVYRLYLLAVLPQVFHYAWVATGLERMVWVGGARVLLSLLYAGLVLAILPGAVEVGGEAARRWVPVCYLAAFTLSNLVLVVPLRRWLGGTPWPRWPGRERLRRRWRDAAPIGAGLLVLRVILNVDLLLLGLLAAPEAAGRYAAASRIAFLLVVAIEVLWGALLPRLSRLAVQSKAAFRAELNRVLGLVLAGVLPIALGGALLGPRLVARLLDPRYELTGEVLRILALSYALLAVATYLGRALIAEDRQDEHFAPLTVAALAAAAAAAWAIPRYGALGAAWAMLGAHALLAGWLLALQRRNLQRELARSVASLAPALLGLATAGRLLDGAGFWWQVAGAAGAYALLAIVPVRRLLRGASTKPAD